MRARENTTDITDLAVKLLDGINKGLRKLIETSAAADRNLIIGDKDGNVKSVPAKELLESRK